MDTYNKALAEYLTLVAGVLDAVHAAANQSNNPGAWLAINAELQDRGLNYASIVKARAAVDYEIGRLGRSN